MKLIKLDRRHTLYHRGYVWAFKFENYDSKNFAVSRAVDSLEGPLWNNTFWGKSKKLNSNNHRIRPYYVGVRKESTATMVMLKLN